MNEPYLCEFDQPDLLNFAPQLAATGQANSYQLVSISVSGDPSAPRYHTCWLLRAEPYPRQVIIQSPPVTGTDWPYETVADQANAGYAPSMVAATSLDGEVVSYALVFEQASPAELANFNVAFGVSAAVAGPPGKPEDADPDSFWAPSALARSLNRYLRWAAVYGIDRAAGIWRLQRGDYTAWAVEMHEPFKSFGERFDAHVAGRSRLELVAPVVRADRVNPDLLSNPTEEEALVAVLPHLRYLSIWQVNSIGPGTTHVLRTKSQFAALKSTLDKRGLYPIRLQVSGTGVTSVYSAIFAHDDRPQPRKFRKHRATVGGAPLPPPALDPFARIDGQVQQWMRQSGIRSAQLAITDHSRLIYAGAFTWAELNYPETELTTQFRWGSCSKTLTAIATVQSAEESAIGLEATLDSAAWEVIGQPPLDPKWSQFTLARAMAQSGGLWKLNADDVPESVDWYGNHLAISLAMADPLPVTEDSIRAYIALRFPAELQDDLRFVYNNTNAWIVGQALRAMNGWQPYNLIMANRVFARVGAIRAAMGGSRVEDRLPDECYYHPIVPDIGNSIVHFNRRLVPAAYGVHNLETGAAQGGAVMPAIDMARVLAALDLKSSPLLTATGIARMWNGGDGTEAGGNPIFLGWFTRFFAVKDPGLPAGSPLLQIPAMWHNGGLPGTQALIWRQTNRMSFAFVANGEFRDLNLGMVPPSTELVLIRLALEAGVGVAGHPDLFPEFYGPW